MLSRSCSTATNSLPATNTRWPTPICSRCSTGPISTRSISQNGRTSRHTWLESVQGRRCRKPCGRKVCWDSTQHPARLHEVRSGHRPDDRQGAWPRSAADASCPRRRGDRMTRHLPPPWRADKFSGGYVVRDANGFAVAYVYGRSTEAEAMEAKQMTMDEARRVASNIAKLP